MKNMKKILASTLSAVMLTGALATPMYADRIHLKTSAVSINGFLEDLPGFTVYADVTFALTEEEVKLWDELTAKYEEYEEDLDAHRTEIQAMDTQWKDVLANKLQEEIDNGFLTEWDVRHRGPAFFASDSPAVGSKDVLTILARPIRIRALTYNPNVVSIQTSEPLDNMWWPDGFCTFGDCNSDRQVTAADASIILAYSAAVGNGTYKRPIDDYVKETGDDGPYPVFTDANNDGLINAADASIILSYATQVGNGAYTGNLWDFANEED